MVLLNKVNTALSIGAVMMGFYHFFVEDLSINAWAPYLFIMYLLFGIEISKREDKGSKLGYIYFAASVLFLAIMIT
ncbi:hypothetical protein [Guptibacillus hwajinpoensis]|uniref:DUF3953 domain-containing protein n=1 Tax=Guptibacillus hwajinpoensis TaxID=208199 RepID=A0ABU0K3H9_9BACL|nr:hypothetical protein [Alkalihalobacillus hemicentroti]MDQ0483917.1 hypothetical protein [Alkalihalobacillus hemicentroti]